jgi:thiol-disulfide isomerase/thioredoxin
MRAFLILGLCSMIPYSLRSGGYTAEAAQNDSPPAAKQKVFHPLKVGDPAPVLKVDKWLQGKPVNRFEPGKVYVIEFWATWCGPCMIFMPELTELQAQYRDQGVTMIGFTALNLMAVPGNTEEKATEFLNKRGRNLRYTFAFANDPLMYDTWMKAAGREGIPCSFVVDRSGRIAHIGNPIYLALVLPKVVSGKQTAAEVGADVAKIEQEFEAATRALRPDNRKGLKALAEFEAKYPALANNVISVKAKLGLLPRLGEWQEAKKVAEEIIAKALRQNNPGSLAQVAGLLRSGAGKENKDLLAVAIRAAQAQLKLTGDKDARALLGLAETYAVAGDRDRAREYAHKALAAASAESAEPRDSIEQAARKLAGENEKKK